LVKQGGDASRAARIVFEPLGSFAAVCMQARLRFRR
jgi:hypothetical protein